VCRTAKDVSSLGCPGQEEFVSQLDSKWCPPTLGMKVSRRRKSKPCAKLERVKGIWFFLWIIQLLNDQTLKIGRLPRSVLEKSVDGF
jgi:hypothetical protein